jgi:hypothetical protein
LERRREIKIPLVKQSDGLFKVPNRSCVAIPWRYTICVAHNMAGYTRKFNMSFEAIGGRHSSVK